MTDKETYYPYFDYLRIILATVVMLYHDKLLVWEHAGSLAVDVFFALSGWLIGGVLLKTEKADLPRFFFNRAVRIWLPYYFACALLIAASLLKDPLDGKWFELIFYKLTFVYNLFGTSQLADPAVSFPLDGTGNHFWSINAEEQFYLLAPLLLVLLPYLGRSKWLWGLIVAVAWVLEIYAPITFGVLAVVLVNRYGHFYSHIWCRIVLAVIAIATAVGMAINDSNYAWYAPVFSICIVLLLAVKGKKRPFGELLGGMSYPLYLNHWVGSFVMNALLEPFGLRDSPVKKVLAAILAFLYCGVLYWYGERKLLSMRSGLYTAKRGMCVVVIAYGMILVGVSVGLMLSYSSIK